MKRILKISIIGIILSLLLASLSMDVFSERKVFANLKDKQKNLALNKPYKLNVDATDPHADNGYKLTDGIFGATDENDEAWVGFEGDPTREIVIDLEDKQSIETIKASFLQVPLPNQIRYPNTISFYVSNNGEDWVPLKHDNPPVPFWIGNQPQHTFVWDNEEDGILHDYNKHKAVYAQYVKIRIQTNTWVLMDEIEVLGREGLSENAIVPKYEEAKYMDAGAHTGEISDLMLLYNGHYNEEGRGEWTKEKIIPYISYVDETGKPKDWFFNGVLYLGLTSLEGRAFEMSPNGSNLIDWQWYLNKTFAPDGDLDELDKAVKEVEDQLGAREDKFPVVLMIPYTARGQTDFGDIDGSGESLNFSAEEVGDDKALANQQKAVHWYINSVLQLWDDKAYEHLELTGLYWLNEEVAPDAVNDPALLHYAGEIVHEHGLNYFWIPRYQGFEFSTWKELGFDAVALQPNHFFNEDSPASRIEDAAKWSKELGMGVEVELDDQLFTDPNATQRYLDYLDGGYEYGYMNNAFKAYYQGGNVLLNAAFSDDPEIRNHYDIMYEFVKGHYGDGEDLGEPTDETLAGLSEQLETYIDAGDVRGPLVNQLRNSLKQANHHLNKGSQQKLAFFVEKFLKHLNNESMQKHVSEDAKAELQSIAQDLLNNLN